MQLVQQPEQRRRKPVYLAVIFGQLQLVGNTRQHAGGLRAGIQIHRNRRFAARGNGRHRHAHSRAVKVVAAAFDVNLAVARRTNGLAVFRLEDPSRHKMMLNHAQPTAIGFVHIFGFVFAGFEIVVQIGEGYFFKLAFGRINHGSDIRLGEIALPFGLAAVAHHAVVGGQVDRLAARVGYVKPHIDQIAAFGESIDFVDFQTVRLRTQTHFGFIAV